MDNLFIELLLLLLHVKQMYLRLELILCIQITRGRCPFQGKRAPGSAKMFFCYLCPESRDTAQEMVGHLGWAHFRSNVMATYLLENSARFCWLCRDEFDSPQQLIHHLSLAHLAIKSLIPEDTFAHLNAHGGFDSVSSTGLLPTWVALFISIYKAALLESTNTVVIRMFRNRAFEEPDQSVRKNIAPGFWVSFI